MALFAGMALWTYPAGVLLNSLSTGRLNRPHQETRTMRFSIENFSNVSTKPDQIYGELDAGFTLKMRSKFKVTMFFHKEAQISDNQFDGRNSKTYLAIYCTMISSECSAENPLTGAFIPKILKANGKVFYLKDDDDSLINFSALGKLKQAYGFKKFFCIDCLKSKLSVIKDDTLLVEIEFIFYGSSTTSNSSEPNLKFTEDSHFKAIFKNIKPKSIKSGVGRDLVTLLENGYLSDVDLDIKGQIFKAHKCVLAARSRVFYAMFKYDMLESRTGKINIIDIEPEIMAVLLVYMYSGKLPKLQTWRHDLHNILFASEKYNLHELIYYLDETIKDKILTSKNWKEIKEIADMFRLYKTSKAVKKFSHI